MSKLNSLIHYEQQVNDRYGTSPAPGILDELLPEQSVSLPLAWKLEDSVDVKIFAKDPATEAQFLSRLGVGNKVAIPVHPLSERNFAPNELMYSGTIQFSASYRTVFYEPDTHGPLSGASEDDRILMLKLHLDEPLPGVPGDRRLTVETIERCIVMSQELVKELRTERMAEDLEIVQENFGVTAGNTGFVARFLPASGLIPLFSLYSKDRSNPETMPLIVDFLTQKYGRDGERAAREIGKMLALPLVRSLLAGFRKGFSLEMHAQNTLIRVGAERLVERVYYRDIEGVVLFNNYRAAKGLTPVGEGAAFNLTCTAQASMHRLFNRNVDHDLGRIFRGTLHALGQCGYFGKREHRLAIESIRRVTREAVEESGLDWIGWTGRVLPFSRAPWGNGSRPGHYFRSEFR